MRQIAAMTLPTTTLPLDQNDEEKGPDAEISRISEEAEEMDSERGVDVPDRVAVQEPQKTAVTLEDVTSKVRIKGGAMCVVCIST